MWPVLRRTREDAVACDCSCAERLASVERANAALREQRDGLTRRLREARALYGPGPLEPAAGTEPQIIRLRREREQLLTNLAAMEERARRAEQRIDEIVDARHRSPGLIRLNAGR